ncbi:MAG: cytochrome c3 family protein [Bryobacterales bacterium]|nr:cytochrome c3 family protein [Bryobacterales bacterium]MBV9399434.1 cytochrome c3 family protein [Bryobacterales bacterium]
MLTPRAKLFFLASLFSACFGQTRPSAAEPPSIAVAPLTAPEGTQFTGSDRCASCHRAESLEYAKTRHASLAATAKNAIADCEMCHGPGKAHADAEEGAHGDDAEAAAGAKLIFAFNANPKQNSERCLRCHQSSRDQKDFTHSTHVLHGVGCNECHSTHLVDAARNPSKTALGLAQANFFSVPKLPEQQRWLHNSLLKKPQPDLCFGCHGNIQAQFALPTHHRVPEGAMKCTDCHNPHGTSNRATLRQSGWETCTQCHVEKRGPFVFEHSAVKVEGCTACHSPHGSVNRMLLVRREERFLCLQCHVDPNAVNVPHGRLGFQTRGDCTRCHAAIHGSNFDVNFLH